MKNKYKIHRGRRSKFNAYDEEIIEMLDAGMPISEVTDRISEHFPDGADYNAVWYYIHSRGFQVKRVKYTGLKEKPPNCDTCGSCTVVIAPDGKDDIRVCLRHRQLVANEVRTSPMWCGRR